MFYIHFRYSSLLVKLLVYGYRKFVKFISKISDSLCKNKLFFFWKMSYHHMQIHYHFFDLLFDLIILSALFLVVRYHFTTTLRVQAGTPGTIAAAATTRTTQIQSPDSGTGRAVPTAGTKRGTLCQVPLVVIIRSKLITSSGAN